MAAVAGVSVLAAYANLLPRPVQQLAHVAVAAPAPPSASFTPSPAVGSLLTGSGGRTGRADPSSPPAGTPQDPDHGAARTSQPPAAHAQSTPRRGLPTASATARPSCPPGQVAAGKPGATVTVPPTAPPWWQTLPCSAPAATHAATPAPKITSLPHLP
jgi:hypothetical protein